MPSGRSYLLALGGSELLLISFTLAAVRLRCLFSPIFLVSWSSQASGEPKSLVDVRVLFVICGVIVYGKETDLASYKRVRPCVDADY